ncbi:dead-like helicase [Gigaspora margarita]|uniref:Dead-like helicase n=1 Tax=Gigaspora margarita TaxID=4874 RepID=A0A8H4AB58_GIGMA|nr:dead-like helicase [Gigaspora margarita]
MGLTNLDYKPGHKEYTFYKYWLASNSYTSSFDRNNTALLNAYQPKEIYSQYIVQIKEKFALVNHPSEVYKILDTHKYIDIACTNALSLIPECIPFLNSFALASSSNAKKCSWYIIYSHAQFIDYRELKGFTEKVTELVGEPYLKIIDIGLPKTYFNLQLLGSAKEGCIKRPAISSVKNRFKNLDDYLVQPKENYSVIWPRTFSSEELVKEESQPIDDENALDKSANLVIEKYRWLQIGKIEKRFINFQAQSIKKCPICDVKYEKDQLYGFIQKNVSDKAELKVKPKLELNKRIAKAVLNSCLLPDLSEEVINVKEMEDFPKIYPNFLSKEPSTTLIRFSMMTEKAKYLRKYLNYLAKNKADLPCIIWISYWKTLSNESIGKINDLKLFGLRICDYQDKQSLSVNKWDIIIVQVKSLSCIEFSARLIVAILDEINAIQYQMNSGSNARKSENAMRDVLRSAQHVLAIDTFANESKTVEYLYDPNSGAEAMRIGIEYLKQGKRVAFVVTSSNMA